MGVRLAVVGYGLVGKRHASAISAVETATLAAVVEPDEDARAQAAKMDAATYLSLAEMLDDCALDGVILATPTPMHVQQGLACIERGLPLLIEKPISVTAQEGQKLIAAARAKGVALLVGHHRRHNGMVQAAKGAIADGAIGEVRAVQATCWFYKPDDYFDVAPWRKKRGAGPISVNLVHDVDLLRHFCGEVVSVRAQAAASRRGYENEDVAAAVLTFASGAIATISVSDSIAAPWSWELTASENPVYPVTSESCYLIGGSEGGLSIPDLRIWTHKERPDWWSPIAARTLSAASLDPLEAQIAHFSRVISGDEEPLVSGLGGLRSLQVVEAIDVSARTGQPVDVVPIDVD